MPPTSEPDVIVIGGGAAGAVVALESHARGGSAVILEARERAGGNSAGSGGSIRLVSDQQALIDYLSQLSQGATPRAVLRSFVAALRDVPDWLARRGGEFGGGGREDPSAHPRMVFPASHAG